MKDSSPKLIFEKSKKDRIGFSLPPSDCSEIKLEEIVNSKLLREKTIILIRVFIL